MDETRLHQEKCLARRRARVRRAAVSPQTYAEASERLRAHLLTWLDQQRAEAVAGFWPLGGEVDLRPLLRDWHDRRRTALLPRVVGPDQPLRFHRWTPTTRLDRSALGVEEPTMTAPEHLPEVVLVPFLAVDRLGYRLGYGGGFYDRTLAALHRVPAVGVGFDTQRVDAVPRGHHDLPLTHLATESGIVTFNRNDPI